MICQRCKKREAEVSHTAAINGKVFSYHLCAVCAGELFGDFEESFSHGVAAGLFDAPAPKKEKVCPLCGMRFSDYQKTGLLGCPSCYDLFREELHPHIAKIQGKTEHVGKSGSGYAREQDELVLLNNLQGEMETALKNGDFALAEKINRRINAIKKKRTGGWQW